MKDKTIKIKKLKIEVEKELGKEVLIENIKIPKGWRLLTLSEASYILENDILNLGLDKIEWITLKGKVASLDSGRSVDGGWLHVGGSDWGGYIGFAFGVRFCRDLK